MSLRRRSQEGLDSRVVYVPRAHRVVLACVLALLAAGAVWAVFGRVPTKVAGQGIINHSGQQLYVVQTTHSGQVERVEVAIGERVEAGRVVLRLRQPELEERLELEERALEDLRSSGAEFKARIAAQQRAVEQARFTLEQSRVVRAQVAGVVEEIHVATGENAGPQDRLMTIASGGEGFEALAFLPAESGSRVTVGMAVHVIPTTVQKAEYGTMRGVVAYVSELPVSTEQIDTLLANRDLAERFAAIGSPYMARVELFPDRESASGFEWWSGGGPPFDVRVGTLVDAEIVVREQAPATLVVPALRRLL